VIVNTPTEAYRNPKTFERLEEFFKSVEYGFVLEMLNCRVLYNY